ncbi:MAG: sigma 54-interacting transcriptional regulator [Phycisphaerales bacterium]
MSFDEAAFVVAARAKRIHEIASLMASRHVRESVLGVSRVWKSCLRRIVEIARFSDANVLITGESGTGKELAARLIHALDGRPKRGPFVVLDCGTVSPELAGSELFGHVRGAYTGAIAEREGAVALADGGTLFLDEFGELPMSIQAQMLRALEDGAYKPVGAIQWKRANFRLVCATNRNLDDDVGEGRFRLDLYHRAIGWHVHLPSLRERSEDIPLLARHFAAMAAGRSEPVELCPAVERQLVQRAYPGNLRELRQLMVRVMTRHVGGGPITLGDIPPEDRSDARRADWPDEQFEDTVRRGLAQGHGMKAIGRDAEALALRVALEDADGNSRRAAEVLGVSERAVQMRRSR